MKRMCLKGGHVVAGDVLLSTDVLVVGEKIAALGDSASFGLGADDEVVDCTGCVVFPGVIDAHCHIALDTGVFATGDDWLVGTSEAAQGGITSVVDFVGPQPGEDLHHALDARLAQAETGIVDHAFHLTALDARPETLCSNSRCREWGISSLKIYTTYRPNYYLDDEAIVSILERASDSDLAVLVHCENDAVVTHETARHRGEDLYRSYPAMRPSLAEVEAARRVIALSEYTGARVVIAHNSAVETARVVAQARSRGIRVFNETAPQYLFLSARDNRESPEPWRYILQPPLRAAEDNEGLQASLLFGAVDMVITDHCAYTREEKIHGMAGGVPGGLPGFATLLPMTASVPGMTWTKLARVLCQNPARIYGLWPRKGAIIPGFDADIVVLRDEPVEIIDARHGGFAGYSPFVGHLGRGRIDRVYRRGECLVCDGKLAAHPGRGEYLRV